MKKDKYGFLFSTDEEDVLAPVTLTEAAMTNPFKSLLILAGTFYLGAFVGRERAVHMGRRSLETGLDLGRRGVGFVADRIGKPKAVKVPTGSSYYLEQMK